MEELGRISALPVTLESQSIVVRQPKRHLYPIGAVIEALEYYANPSNRIDLDRGRKARKALDAIKAEVE